jgi:hypothetical protein
MSVSKKHYTSFRTVPQSTHNAQDIKSSLSYDAMLKRSLFHYNNNSTIASDSDGQDYIVAVGIEMSHDSLSYDSPPPIIYLSHGCLLIPVFIAAWWYYTKQACRAFVRGLLRNAPEHHHYQERFSSTCGHGCSDDNISSNHGTFARMEDVPWYVSKTGT